MMVRRRVPVHVIAEASRHLMAEIGSWICSPVSSLLFGRCEPGVRDGDHPVGRRPCTRAHLACRLGEGGPKPEVIRVLKRPSPERSATPHPEAVQCRVAPVAEWYG